MPAPAALLALHQHRMLAVIRAATAEQALASARAVARGGLPLLEVTFTVPDTLRIIAELARDSSLVVGAGTALTAAQASDAIAAGARFIVAPNVSPAVAAVARAAGVMYCPGAYTTGEIIAARDAGADIVKVYPVGVAGGPAYISVIRDPLPNIPMLAAGGTNLINLIPFLSAGCVGVGLGGALADPALAAAGRFDEITERTRAFVACLDEARAAGHLPATAISTA